ncbi:LysR substrate-binding domain-containing protein, partial [Burkholderia cenocepacia]|nr:LysR substrate-binding domain-containing protein [Burkholderia cenocepacia]
GDTTSIAGQAALRIDAITAVHAAAVAGLGIAAFTHLTVARDIAEGRLVRILPGYRLGRLNYYAVYPRHRHTPSDEIDEAVAARNIQLDLRIARPKRRQPRAHFER